MGRDRLWSQVYQELDLTLKKIHVTNLLLGYLLVWSYLVSGPSAVHRRKSWMLPIKAARPFWICIYKTEMRATHWLHWQPASLDRFQSQELPDPPTLWCSFCLQKAFRQPTPSSQRRWGTVVDDGIAAQTPSPSPPHHLLQDAGLLWPGLSQQLLLHSPLPSPSSPPPLLHWQQSTACFQTGQQQPTANLLLLSQFLCSSFGGRERPEGSVGTAARRKGKREPSGMAKVGLCSPGWEMELLGVGLPKSWPAEVEPPCLKRNPAINI